jgi:hypothetical protein
MQGMSDAEIIAQQRQLDPTACANELMGVLSRTDTHTAKAALQIADALNAYRATVELSDRLEAVHQEYRASAQPHEHSA